MSVRMRVVCEERAQATVELAVVAPVLVVLALISYNMMVFVSASARFDRVAPDIVLAHGGSPSAPVVDAGAEERGTLDDVERELRCAMEGYGVEIEVEIVDGDRGGAPSADGVPGRQGGRADSPALGLVGSLRTFTCVMRYRPWPQGWSLAGVQLGTPFFIEHERSVTIDPWRSGVIV